MHSGRRQPVRIALLACCVLAVGALVTPASAAQSSKADTVLQRALDAIVKRTDGPPGISVVVQRGASPELLTAGVADVTTDAPFAGEDAMRLASVAKAFSGAAAVSTVADGKLSLDDTIGKVLPDQPAAWSKITLGQLLQHTSGIPDFSKNEQFKAALVKSLTVAPPPAQLVAYVADEPLKFTPGSKYAYSNSDNILVGLMVEAATGTSYEDALKTQVYQPLQMTNTSLPSGVEVPSPSIHGYVLDPPDPPDDVTESFAAGWTWASGGVVSTPTDANLFVRGYVSGKLTDAVTQRKQFTFRAGSSEPPGPGTNSAGMAVFRYQTSCGTVYGHTGNTPGYTQFIAATRNGKRSTVVSINSQLTPDRNPKRFADLRKIYGLAVCAALEGS